MSCGVMLSLSPVMVAVRITAGDLDDLQDKFEAYKFRGWEVCKGAYLKWNWRKFKIEYACDIMKVWE